MRVLNKGSSLILRETIFPSIYVIFFIAFASLSLFTNETNAQTAKSKPKLVEVVLNEETRNDAATDLVLKLVNANKKTNKTLKKQDFIAKSLPLAKKGSKDRFIAAKFTSSDFGGCPASGCYTILYKSDGEKNNWSVVFAAFVERMFYDKESTKSRHANLVFTSERHAGKLAVWMWDGQRYNLINAK